MTQLTPTPSATMPDLSDAGRMTVNDVLLRWPRAVGPLNAFGIDTCCGGNDRLDHAASEAGVKISDLWQAIVSATAEAG